MGEFSTVFLQEHFYQFARKRNVDPGSIAHHRRPRPFRKAYKSVRTMCSCRNTLRDLMNPMPQPERQASGLWDAGVNFPTRVPQTFLQEHFCICYSEQEARISDGSARDSVPVGTLDVFCTQIHWMHSRSSLHLKCLADYAAQ